jgi:CheY-like chemotaxis protein
MTRTRSIRAVIIDDEPAVLCCVRKLLERRGYEVATYQNPVDYPVANIRSCPCPMQRSCPDVIISDLDMPDISGIQLFEGMYAKGCRCRHAALISGRGIEETELIRMAKYGTRFFMKPLDLLQFYSWLDGVEKDVAECQVF